MYPFSVYTVPCTDSYRAGDVVIMTPFNTLRGAVPTVLHLQWKKPLILMDFTCLEPLGIKPGKVYVVVPRNLNVIVSLRSKTINGGGSKFTIIPIYNPLTIQVNKVIVGTVKPLII